eukprot:12430442-Karenia_brevis.AAC.1
MKIFDDSVRAALEKIQGSRINDTQWEQASLPNRLGGAGLLAVADRAEAAYCVSRAAAQERCRAIFPDSIKPQVTASRDPLDNAIIRLNAKLPADAPYN